MGDVREVLAGLPERSIQTIVTSPPYWGLRDYNIPKSTWPDGWEGCLGLEPTPEMFIEHLVEVCRALWRVLRDDGTLWWNIGDSYSAGGRGYGGKHNLPAGRGNDGWHSPPPGLKHKDLVMMPHRVALALQEDRWYVRSTIVWAKPNPMPESCTDRPTSAYEYIFLLTKKPRYFYDADAVREPMSESSIKRYQHAIDTNEKFDPDKHKNTEGVQSPMDILTRAAQNVVTRGSRNLRNVWRVPTQPYPEAHFATFPERIPELCIKVGTSEWGCCPQCGAPWERVVEKEEGYGKRRCTPGEAGQAVHPEGITHDLDGPPRTTKGFQPTCECVEEWQRGQPTGPKDKVRSEQGLRTSAAMGGGAGWRKREKEAVDEWKRSCGADSKGEYHGKAIKDYEGTGAENPSEVKARILEGMVPKVTTGYKPTCDCAPDEMPDPLERYLGPPELEPVPCVVLDPFAGSGTTLKVARDLGRSAIGIDISEEYKKLAVERARLNTKDILSYNEKG